jgi:hypothetical protein
MAFLWMSLQDPRERLARWIVEMRTFQFNVLHEKGDGELMALPGALSWDTFLTRGVTLCNRCLKGVKEVEEIAELEAPGNEGDAITWDGDGPDPNHRRGDAHGAAKRVWSG